MNGMRVQLHKSLRATLVVPNRAMRRSTRCGLCARPKVGANVRAVGETLLDAVPRQTPPLRHHQRRVVTDEAPDGAPLNAPYTSSVTQRSAKRSFKTLGSHAHLTTVTAVGWRSERDPDTVDWQELTELLEAAHEQVVPHRRRRSRSVR